MEYFSIIISLAGFAAVIGGTIMSSREKGDFWYYMAHNGEDISSIIRESQRAAAKVFFYFYKKNYNPARKNEDYHIILYRKIDSRSDIYYARGQVRRLLKKSINPKYPLKTLVRNARYDGADYRALLIRFMFKYVYENGGIDEKNELGIRIIAEHLKVLADFGQFKDAYLQHAKNEEEAKRRAQDYYRRQSLSSGYDYGLKSAFGLLGLNESADAGEIKSAYRRLVHKWHPDRFANKSEEEIDKAEDKFQELTAAYELIKLKRGIS